MATYKTFLRSATNWNSYATSRKITQSTGLTAEEAREQCKQYNDNLTSRQIRKGTKMEYAQE